MLVDVIWEEALDSLLRFTNPLPGESVTLMQALDRVVCQDLYASRNLPPYPQSAVDGYAIHVDDLGKCKKFKVQERLQNGDMPGSPLTPGQTAGVVTGGPLPGNTGAVITQESVTVEGDYVIFTGKTQQGGNIKPLGEDFRAGELLARRGTHLDPGLIGVLAAFGNSIVPVYRRPQVMILSLGNEVVPCHTTPAPGRVWDSNGPLIASYVIRDGGQVGGVEIASGKKPDGIKKQLKKMLKQADLVLTIGGGAFGICDNALSELQGIGADILFWGVKIKPGSHTGAAVADSKLIISLSGNPGACAVGYQLLAAPVIRALQGLNPYPQRISALCIDSFPKSGGTRRFLRALASCRQNGWVVNLQPGQKNSMLRSLIGCNALVELPAGHPPLEPQSQVSVILLNPANQAREKDISKNDNKDTHTSSEYPLGKTEQRIVN